MTPLIISTISFIVLKSPLLQPSTQAQLLPPPIIAKVEVAPPEPPKPVEPPYPKPDLSGGGYAFGNCTIYAYEYRLNTPKPISNTWGNANTWLYYARLEGYPTGDVPEVGAVAWMSPGNTLGHVAIVIETYADGTFLISEMNSVGYNIVNTRRIYDPWNWAFIY